LPGKFNDPACVMRNFCELRRIGKLQMQRHDPRMENVTTI
jgi:hypothetical protein